MDQECMDQVWDQECMDQECMDLEWDQECMDQEWVLECMDQVWDQECMGQECMDQEWVMECMDLTFRCYKMKKFQSSSYAIAENEVLIIILTI
jgi:hypothetical protein